MIKQLIVRIITKEIIKKKQNIEDFYFLNYFDFRI
jgi:hypothetical protein